MFLIFRVKNEFDLSFTIFIFAFTLQVVADMLIVFGVYWAIFPGCVFSQFIFISNGCLWGLGMINLDIDQSVSRVVEVIE